MINPAILNLQKTQRAFFLNSKAVLILLSFLFFNMITLQAQIKNPYAGSKTAFMHDDAHFRQMFFLVKFRLAI